MFDNMHVTLSQMYVANEERKFKHKVLGCNDDFSKLQKTFRKGKLCRMSTGHLMLVP
jgi:hypothetical protein